MVEQELISLLQSTSYIAGALGVCIAAAYYIINLRVSQRALKINMTNSLLQSYASEEGQRRWIDLMNMKWSNYDEFERKYGSDDHPDKFAMRQSVFINFNSMGHLLKQGLVDRETIYNVTTMGAPWIWAKFKPIIMESEKRYSGKDNLIGFEYLVKEIMRMKLERDPSYKIPETLTQYVPEK